MGERAEKKKNNRRFNTYPFIIYQCQALQVWKFQALLKSAAALEGGKGRSLCGGQTCPGGKINIV